MNALQSKPGSYEVTWNESWKTKMSEVLLDVSMLPETITTENDATKATEFSKELASMARQLETSRNHILDPVRTFSNNVNRVAKDAKGRLDQTKEILRSKLNDYAVKENERIQAEQAKIKKEQDRLRREREEAIEEQRQKAIEEQRQKAIEEQRQKEEVTAIAKRLSGDTGQPDQPDLKIVETPVPEGLIEVCPPVDLVKRNKDLQVLKDGSKELEKAKKNVPSVARTLKVISSDPEVIYEHFPQFCKINVNMRDLKSYLKTLDEGTEVPGVVWQYDKAMKFRK